MLFYPIPIGCNFNVRIFILKTIAIVINTNWNIFNFRVSLLKSLQAQGYKIIAIAPHDKYVPKLEALGIECHPIVIHNKGVNPFQDLKLIFDFYRLYKMIKPEVLLHYTIKPNIYGGIAAWLVGIPVISNISGLGTVFLNNKLSSRIARLLYKVALKSPKTVFFQNKDDRALFIQLKLVAKEKTALLPGSGINTQEFLPIAVNKTNTDLQFLFIGRLLKDKGLVEYVEAARLLKIDYPRVQFLVLGAFYAGNPTAISVQTMTEWEQQGLVTYLGVSDHVASIIASVDCVVLPSYREGLSRVLLEAASMAKPIVTTNVPGCRDVVDEGVNGFLCQPKNVEDLVRAIKKMIHLEPEEREKIGKKGREKVVAEFDDCLVIEKYINKINGL